MIHLRDPDGAAIREVVTDLLLGVKSVAALSRTIGKSRGTLYKWKSGDSTPSIGELCALARALEVHIRIDMGHEEGENQKEDIAVLLGRVLANQQRMAEELRQLRGGD